MDFNVSGSGMEGLALLAIFWSLAVTIFWMVIGWRAMRAHEGMARTIERWEARPGAGREERG